MHCPLKAFCLHHLKTFFDTLVFDGALKPEPTKVYPYWRAVTLKQRNNICQDLSSRPKMYVDACLCICTFLLILTPKILLGPISNVSLSR